MYDTNTARISRYAGRTRFCLLRHLGSGPRAAIGFNGSIIELELKLCTDR